ncbi:MAG: formylglycine-generating enzyme family protein [Planctomycetes bacterium]|nr:formylglycine-generating enzyme family protein [Planctomycetota bacterium]
MSRSRRAFVLLAAAALTGCPSPTPGPHGDLVFSPAQLPEATVGKPYSTFIVASNAETPVGDMKIASGALPAGLTFAFREEERRGEISGTPTAAGRSPVTIEAWCYGTQRSGQTGRQTWEIVVQPSASETEAVFLDDAKTVRMDFVKVKAGTFTMGTKGEEKREARQVTLTKDFWLQTTEVTQAQWGALMGTNPSANQDPNCPVERVSWDDCQAFVAKLNARLKGKTASLPTEAEWEYACRAGSAAKWSFGDDPSRITDHAWLASNSGKKTQPVGKKLPNAWGLYDMHGNVWEWCQDWYGPYRGDETDPAGPEEGVARVWKGGSFTSEPTHARSAHALWCAPDWAKGMDTGFRVLMR